MGQPKGVITAEDLESEIKVAGAEMEGVQTIDELLDLWRRNYLRIGHRALGRMFLAKGKNAAVIAERAAARLK
jgi:hypothetical protein